MLPSEAFPVCVIPLSNPEVEVILASTFSIGSALKSLSLLPPLPPPPPFSTGGVGVELLLNLVTRFGFCFLIPS